MIVQIMSDSKNHTKRAPKRWFGVRIHSWTLLKNHLDKHQDFLFYIKRE